MRREKKTALTAWLETWNPLRGMSIRDAQNLFDVSRQGDTQRLHWMFQEIEATNPVLLVCVERRSSAIANFRWKVAEIAARDGALSEEQKDAAERLLNGITNFTDTLEHLDLAFFRGFAHAQPIWEPDGTVREISLLDSWKFVRQGGEWFYNPKCTGFVDGDMQETTNARLMTVTRKRPIDYPALGIHIRHAVGSRDWGRFLERYALPKPAVFMHPNATNEQRGDYLEGAQAVENGQVSVWPNGASLTDFAGGARGTDPFGAFIDHQEKQIVLLATGGTLMSLAESGAGTLAGNAQSDVWHSIVARDSAVIAQCVQKSLVEPYLAEVFRSQPCAVRFGFDFDEPPTAKEVFEIAAVAKQAGWTIDQQQLEETTGYTLVRDEMRNEELRMMNYGGVVSNKEKANSAIPHSSFLIHHSIQPPQNASGQEDVLAAFSKDNGPAAEAVKKLLENPTPESAAALLKDLPTLMPEDPEMAAVIAEEMAKQFAVPVANKVDANGREHADGGEGGGQFVEKGGASGGKAEKSEDKPKSTDDDLGPNDSGEGLAEPMKNLLKQGHASVEKVLSSKADVMNAMTDPELGQIDFRWSANNHGIKHIIERRNAYKAKHPEAPSGEEIVRKIPSIIARGERTTEGRGLRADTIIVYKKHRIILTPSFNKKPSNRWVLSEYDINPDAAGYRKGRKSRSGANGEGVNSSAATHQKPTRASSSDGSASI